MSQSTSTGLSFKFSKSSRGKLTGGIKVENGGEEHEEKNVEIKKGGEKFISLWSSDTATTTDDANDEHSSLVIPALANTLNFKPNASTLDDLAKNALIEEAKRLKEGVIESDSSKKVAATMIIPNSNHSTDRPDFSQFPESSDDADYDAVPVEAYGKALLRGLGWKEGQPIGKSAKKTVAPIVTAPRPKGLGLGAELPKHPKVESVKKSKKNDEEEELICKKGVHFVTKKGEYGTIVGIDEDNARIMGEMKLSKTVVTLSQHAVRLVTKDEFEKQSKIINKQKYDEYKNEEKVVEEETRRKSPKLDKKSEKISNSSKSKNYWLFPDLRVRIVDESYCKGKFYKEKVKVVDVPTKDVCNCRAESGKMLENLEQRQLETVIPRNENSRVMIVAGKYRGKLGTLIERDSKKCRAEVKLSDNDVRRFDFEEICEYVG